MRPIHHGKHPASDTRLNGFEGLAVSKAVRLSTDGHWGSDEKAGYLADKRPVKLTATVSGKAALLGSNVEKKFTIMICVSGHLIMTACGQTVSPISGTRIDCFIPVPGHPPNFFVLSPDSLATHGCSVLKVNVSSLILLGSKF
ncbi:hypothetical protein BaRGS_00019936 [Batillaria attramentaria]|uniref:Uncharacterized protein n=1 Tax=Batillaria attramentaria TaxID=370345 RepID=A0ABD0KNK4_9CAEN